MDSHKHVEVGTQVTTTKPIKITSLRLDPENPRLPEGLKRTQSEMLHYLYENETLDELAQSYIDNGFFLHEPILVLKEGDHYVVVEGNRRLATLMILHGRPEAEGLSFPGIQPSRSQLAQLIDIPAFQLRNREEVHRYLGFRHIGGIKTWDADAKARYLQGEVERAVARKSVDPFREVGRRVGSNAQGVRNSYTAIMILVTARDEFGIDVTRLMQERFGVWVRCMSSGPIREYIGLDSPRTYSEVTTQLQNLKRARLTEVVGDLTPPEGKAKAIVSDSRQVTDYGRVLANETARQALRRYGDLSVAAQIVDYAGLRQRLLQIVESCKLFFEQLPYRNKSDDLQEPAEQLVAVATSIRDLVIAGTSKKGTPRKGTPKK